MGVERNIEREVPPARREEGIGVIVSNAQDQRRELACAQVADVPPMDGFANRGVGEREDDKGNQSTKYLSSPSRSRSGGVRLLELCPGLLDLVVVVDGGREYLHVCFGRLVC
jgi:hypothetical protein